MPDRRRISYVPLDIEDARTNFSLVAHEILLNYNTNDINIIEEDGTSVWSLQEYIAKKLADKLGPQHALSSNAHMIVSENNNGFMSKDMFKNLSKTSTNLGYVISLIKETEKLNGVNIKYKKIQLDEQDNTFLNVYVEIYNGFLFKIEKNLHIPVRPQKEFTNLDGNVGIRKDLIVLEYNDKKLLDLNYYTNISINSQEKIIAIESENNIFDYDEKQNKLEDSKGKIMYPLYIIEMKNNEFVSADNIYGKLSDELDPTEIYDFEITHERIETSIYKTNVKKQLTTSTIFYIPFNLSSKDIISGQDIGKINSYKKSPFGYMLQSSYNFGNYLAIEKLTKFSFEFMIDTTHVSDETIIEFLDQNIINVFNISIEGKELVITDNINNQLRTFLPKEKFSFIRIAVNSSLHVLTVFVNEKTIGSITTTLDLSSIRQLYIPAMKTSIGELFMTKNINYYNKDIKNNFKLFEQSIFYGDKKVIDKEFTFKLTDENKFFKIIPYNSTPNKLVSGDYLLLSFNDNLSLVPDNTFEIKEYSGNKIIVPNNNFKEGDIVTIENSFNNVFNTKIISKNSDIVYIEEIPNFNLLNCKIYNISTDSSYFKLTYNGLDVGDIYKDKDFYKVFIKEEIPMNTEFKIKFKKIIDSEKDLDNTNVKEVLFDNQIAISYTDTVFTFNMERLTFKYNGNYLNKDYISKGNLLFMNDFIEIEISMNIKDFVDISKVTPELLNKAVNINSEIELSSGSNEVEINGEKFNRGNLITTYRLNNNNIKIEDDGTVKIIIKTKKQAKEGKLLLKSLSIMFSINFLDTDRNSKSFLLFDPVAYRVTDYILLKNDEIFLNSNKECTIVIEKGATYER